MDLIIKLLLDGIKNNTTCDNNNNDDDDTTHTSEIMEHCWKTPGQISCYDALLYYCSAMIEAGFKIDLMQTYPIVNIDLPNKHFALKRYIAMNNVGLSSIEKNNTYDKMIVLHNYTHLVCVVPDRLQDCKKARTCLVFDSIGFVPEMNNVFFKYLKSYGLRPKRLNFKHMPIFENDSNSYFMEYCIRYVIRFAAYISLGKHPDKAVLYLAHGTEDTDLLSMQQFSDISL